MDARVGNVQGAQAVVERLHEACRAAQVEVIVGQWQVGLEQRQVDAAYGIVIVHGLGALA
ncbi:hypothetical protein D3C71_2020910 [compost metagenome]